MKLIEIIVIAIISIYLLLMLIYFSNRISKGKGISSECDICKNKGKELIKFYYKQKKKELKRNNKLIS